jgi:CRP/FNR family transcriptional regulator, anaerobic regulatory protein
MRLADSNSTGNALELESPSQGGAVDLALPDRGCRTRTTEYSPRGSPFGPQPCTAWAPADFGLFAGVDLEVTQQVARMLSKRIRFRKGDALFRVGDAFASLYAIRSGSCKTVLLSQAGQDQVAGYHMTGEIIGTDGIGTHIHDCQATALEEMEVCPLPFDQIEKLARTSDPLRRNLHQVLSQESARARALMLVLGTMRAEQRLGVFLLDLSQQYRAHGYSSCEFVMRLTREEIGSYLGLKLETVSRLFSRFQHEGLILVQGRAVKLLDLPGVKRLVVGEGLRDFGNGDKSAHPLARKQYCKMDGTPITFGEFAIPG